MMKVAQDYTLLYDAHCPLCDAYSSAFIHVGFLAPNGRVNWTAMPSHIQNHINLDRSRHEIALVNAQSGDVFYGIDSLFFILASNMKWFEILFNHQWIKSLFKLLYNLISYNRHLIIPRSANNPSKCAPDFNWFWRAMYLTLAMTFTVLVLNSFSLLVFTKQLPLWLDFAVLFVHYGIQALIVKLTKGSVWDYWAHNATVLLIGALWLLPALWLPASLVWMVYPYFSLVILFLFWLHYLRVKTIQYSNWLTVAWLLYRVVLLGIGLSINLIKL